MKPARRQVQPRRRRFLSLLAALCLALGGPLTLGVVSASPALAATTKCSGFTACEAAPYTDHGWGQNLSNSYWGQYKGDNCTNYVAYYEQAVNGMSASRPSWLGSGNADAWATEAAGGGITVSSTPVVGAIAQWGDYGWNGDSTHPEGYGHVGIVEDVSNNGATVEVSWDSYSAGPYKWVSLNSTDANTSKAPGWPNNFIYAGGVSASVGGGTPTPTYVASVAKPVVYTVGGTQYIDVYAVASDQYIYGNTWNGVSWTTQSTKAGCCFQRNPTPVTYQVGGTSYIDLYATNLSNGHLYRNTWNGSSWAGMNWQDLGCCFWSDPAAVSYTVGSTAYIDVYATSNNGHMYRKTWNGVSWTGSSDMGCCFTDHAPTAITYNVGGTAYIDVFATNSSSQIYRDTWNGSTWTGFGYTNCCFWSDPAAVAYTVGGTQYIDLYANSSNSHMYRDIWNGTSWSGSIDIGCCFTNHAPTAVTYTVGSTAYIDVYTLASDTSLYFNRWNGSTWNSQFTPFGCCFASDPNAVVLTGSPPQTEVFAVGKDTTIYYYLWDGTTWSYPSRRVNCCFDHLSP